MLPHPGADSGRVIDMCSSKAAGSGCSQGVEVRGVQPAGFLDAVGRLAAGCSIIASSDGARRSGLSSTAVCAVTADPPRLLACVARDEYTHELIVESGVLSINLLAESQGRLARVFDGKARGEPVDGFQEGAWVAGLLGAPILQDSLASFDCLVVEVVPACSHTIFICEVVDLMVRENLRPLIGFNRAYGALLVTQEE